jgi:DNA polymerase-3 subunit epsilon
MNSLLDFSIFKDVLFPPLAPLNSDAADDLSLRRSIRYQVHALHSFRSSPIVVFDLETTGLDSKTDRIIEIGAQKILDGEVIDQFSTLVHVDLTLSDEIQKLTGITPTMLEGMPKIDSVMPSFLKFIESSILVAHNATFDLNFIKNECNRLHIDIEWPCFCTLKMAQELLEDLERKNLDSLARHYGLSFEARHRSIGDVKVTVGVLQEMLNNEASHLTTWKDLKPFHIL